ncbi:hypothetical protein SO802_009273 [Lithocarpus litseifolius]|uniref:Uncharacterized protein n=1 Tax=Lithocarpus litseifolius TaxID=425828 RepID=A0AAW2DF95_9ROSI
MVSSTQILTFLPTLCFLTQLFLPLFLRPRRRALSCPHPPREDSWLELLRHLQRLVVQALGAQIKGARPDVVFHFETKANVVRMEFVKIFIKFDYKVVVEAKGSARGLCMLWKEGLSISEGLDQTSSFGCWIPKGVF